jgi:hypothetical protein
MLWLFLENECYFPISVYKAYPCTVFFVIICVLLVFMEGKIVPTHILQVIVEVRKYRKSHDSSVGIVLGCRLDDRGSRV